MNRNIVKEKTKLLYHCKDYAIINYDDKYLSKLNLNINTIKCSIIDDSTDIYVKKTSINTANIIVFSKSYSSTINVLGKHNLNNIALSIGVAKALKIDDQHIISCIEKLKNVEHRLSLNTIDKWNIIDDSYNSNEIGFINA